MQESDLTREGHERRVTLSDLTSDLEDVTDIRRLLAGHGTGHRVAHHEHGPLLGVALVARVGVRWAIVLSIIPGLVAAGSILVATFTSDPCWPARLLASRKPL